MFLIYTSRGGCCNDGSGNSVVCPRCHPGCSSPKKGHWKGSVDPVQPIGHPGDWIKVAGDTKHLTQVSCMTHLASNWLNCSVESSRWGSAHMSIVPYQVKSLFLARNTSSSQTFPTSDGFLTIGCGNNNQFAELCTRMGEADLASEDKYASNERRVENRQELIGKLSKVLSSKTNSQWCEAFKGVSFPYGPVNKMSEVFEEPQVQQSSNSQILEGL